MATAVQVNGGNGRGRPLPKHHPSSPTTELISPDKLAHDRLVFLLANFIVSPERSVILVESVDVALETG